MSAIAGVVWFDGRPCDARDLAALASLLAHRIHDGAQLWCDGPAGLMHGRTIATPESARETQPVVDRAAHTAITFDGRLDNRGELFDALHVGSSDRASIGDAELTLRLYDRHGADVASRLLGDFAFAIWDASQRRLVCARDHMGAKPLCYRVRPGGIAWASEAGALARYDGAVPAINEGMVAEHLAGVITSQTDTLFDGIQRVPAAHVLVADAGGVRVSRYWTPDLCAELRRARDEDYVDELRDLIRRAVTARLRVDGGVAVSLSGGVDSSSITAIATELCRAREVPATHVEAFSLLDSEADESAFWTQTVDRCAIESTTVSVTPLAPGQLAEEAHVYFDVPNAPNAAYTDRLRCSMRAHGLRVGLNGAGADDWFGASPWAYADLLRRGRLAALARRLRDDAAADEFIGWRSAAKAAMWPLVPAHGKRVVRALLRRGRAPEWMSPRFAARVGLRDRLARHDIDLPHSSYERYDAWHEAMSGAGMYQQEMIERSTARTGVEMWHPFIDRRILTFGLALPVEQRWRAGVEKAILRRAMAPYLPPAVAQRQTSPAATHLVLKGLETEGGAALFEGMLTAKRGWVDERAVRARFTRATALYHAGDDRYHWLAVSLWRVAAVELWARAIGGAVSMVQYMQPPEED